MNCIWRGCKRPIKTKRLCNTHLKTLYILRLKVKLCKILGKIECKTCKFKCISALQFDHIDGKGYGEHAKLGDTGFYRFYINNPKLAKKKLQVLCANCNWIKRVTNNEVSSATR